MDAVTVHSDFAAQGKNYVTASTFSPSFCHKVIEPDAVVLVIWMLKH